MDRRECTAGEGPGPTPRVRQAHRHKREVGCRRITHPGEAPKAECGEQNLLHLPSPEAREGQAERVANEGLVDPVDGGKAHGAAAFALELEHGNTGRYALADPSEIGDRKLPWQRRKPVRRPSFFYFVLHIQSSIPCELAERNGRPNLTLQSIGSPTIEDDAGRPVYGLGFHQLTDKEGKDSPISFEQGLTVRRGAAGRHEQ